jgi:hypothetical protein
MGGSNTSSSPHAKLAQSSSAGGVSASIMNTREPARQLLTFNSTSKSFMSELETKTIQKQRRELQLLIAELQDRDRELNKMVASHQKQLLAWDMTGRYYSR